MTDPLILSGPESPHFRRGPKEWIAVFDEACKLQSYPKIGFGYSQIQEIADAHGIKISREGIRIKLNRYLKRGYVKKKSRGHYQIAPKGYYFFGFIDKPILKEQKAVLATPP